jgi:hypothetical protein
VDADQHLCFGPGTGKELMIVDCRLLNEHEVMALLKSTIIYQQSKILILGVHP